MIEVSLNCCLRRDRRVSNLLELLHALVSFALNLRKLGFVCLMQLGELVFGYDTIGLGLRCCRWGGPRPESLDLGYGVLLRFPFVLQFALCLCKLCLQLADSFVMRSLLVLQCLDLALRGLFALLLMIRLNMGELFTERRL